jgi:hypothetical protein
MLSISSHQIRPRGYLLVCLERVRSANFTLRWGFSRPGSGWWARAERLSYNVSVENSVHKRLLDQEREREWIDLTMAFDFLIGGKNAKIAPRGATRAGDRWDIFFPPLIIRF